MQTSVTKILEGEQLSEADFLSLLTYPGDEIERAAGALARKHFSNTIYLRGLIEMTNYCSNNCYYCGIRRDNKKVQRYRLSREQILDTCVAGAELGFQTFVLQGGEDPYWRGERLVDLVAEIHGTYPGITITLSLGEMSTTIYQQLYDAGARRYLLRHETIDPQHFSYLHPSEQTLKRRLECLQALKEIGYETGVGGMVGSPAQTLECLSKDLSFIQSFQPAMIGIGPFIPHVDTPFRDFPHGGLELTVRMVALCRLLCPKANIPATTAVASLSEKGRLMAIEAGANVVMPNLSPPDYRALYALYDGKAYSGSEAAEGLIQLKAELHKCGFETL